MISKHRKKQKRCSEKMVDAKKRKTQKRNRKELKKGKRKKETERKERTIELGQREKERLYMDGQINSQKRIWTYIGILINRLFGLGFIFKLLCIKKIYLDYDSYLDASYSNSYKHRLYIPDGRNFSLSGS